MQHVWGKLLGRDYRKAKLVLFDTPFQTTCGVAESSIGPFYCPGDEKAYIDLSFYDELERRFGAAGDFAQAYVLAHEIGHHVQNVTGVERQVRALQQRQPGAANQLSVLMELQADCYAGVWGHLPPSRSCSRLVTWRRGSGRRRDRRRPHPEDGRTTREPGVVHARVVGAARRVVQARDGVRRPERLRHLQGRGSRHELKTQSLSAVVSTHNSRLRPPPSRCAMLLISVSSMSMATALCPPRGMMMSA